jgi:hypothetical protein
MQTIVLETLATQNGGYTFDGVGLGMTNRVMERDGFPGAHDAPGLECSTQLIVAAVNCARTGRIDKNADQHRP